MLLLWIDLNFYKHLAETHLPANERTLNDLVTNINNGQRGFDGQFVSK